MLSSSNLCLKLLALIYKSWTNSSTKIWLTATRNELEGCVGIVKRLEVNSVKGLSESSTSFKYIWQALQGDTHALGKVSPRSLRTWSNARNPNLLRPDGFVWLKMLSLCQMLSTIRGGVSWNKFLFAPLDTSGLTAETLEAQRNGLK